MNLHRCTCPKAVFLTLRLHKFHMYTSVQAPTEPLGKDVVVIGVLILKHSVFTCDLSKGDSNKSKDYYWHQHATGNNKLKQEIF